MISSISTAFLIFGIYYFFSGKMFKLSLCLSLSVIFNALDKDMDKTNIKDVAYYTTFTPNEKKVYELCIKVNDCSKKDKLKFFDMVQKARFSKPVQNILFDDFKEEFSTEFLDKFSFIEYDYNSKYGESNQILYEVTNMSEKAIIINSDDISKNSNCLYPYEVRLHDIMPTSRYNEFVEYINSCKKKVN